MDLIIKAAQRAKQCHIGQYRKYTGRPYIEHPMRVAGEVAMHEFATPEMVAAAWLHDVVEDCGVAFETLANEFPASTVDMVRDLTNPSKKLKCNRADKKRVDREHAKTILPPSRIIKFIDRIDNIREMTGAPPDFKTLYCKESRMLADALLHGHDEHWWLNKLRFKLIQEIERLESQ